MKKVWVCHDIKWFGLRPLIVQERSNIIKSLISRLFSYEKIIGETLLYVKTDVAEYCKMIVTEPNVDVDTNPYIRIVRKKSSGDDIFDFIEEDEYKYLSLTLDNPLVKCRTVYNRPYPKQVMTNSKNGKDYVTVIWKDGTNTVICRSEDEPYDIEKAIMYAVIKKMCGNNGCEMDRYFDKFLKCQFVHGEKEVTKE